MSTIPPSIDLLNKALPGIGKIIQSLGGENVQMVSIRSIRFDLKEPRTLADGTKVNRVKITADTAHNTVDVKFYEVVEHHHLAGIAPTDAAHTITNMLNSGK